MLNSGPAHAKMISTARHCQLARGRDRDSIICQGTRRDSSHMRRPRSYSYASKPDSPMANTADKISSTSPSASNNAAVSQIKVPNRPAKRSSNDVLARFSVAMTTMNATDFATCHAPSPRSSRRTRPASGAC